jgi:choline dehydrogenase-like flavoprotein
MHLWAGRCGTMDPIDHAQRDWVNTSGWPISHEELAPYYEKALQRLHCPFPCAPLLNPVSVASANGEPTDIEAKNFYVLDYIDGDFIKNTIRKLVNLDKNITIIEKTTVVSLEEDNKSHVQYCNAFYDGRKSPPPKPCRIHADHFVIACGGIETTRLLLNSQSSSKEGIGNAHDLVGRFFSDHPRMKTSTFEINASAPLLNRDIPKGHQVAFRFTEEAQIREQMLNHAFMIGKANADIETLAASVMDTGDSSKKKSAFSLRSHARRFWRMTPNWFRRTLKAVLAHKGGRKYVMTFKIELEPNAESRIRLSSELDRHGTQKASIDWKITDRDRQNLAAYFSKIEKFISQAGITKGPVKFPDPYNDRNFKDSSHPIGATRMAASEKEGVVDADLRVFRTPNLFICSSSVFPTPGSVNPTLTIAALALRLADTLAAERALKAATAN